MSKAEIEAAAANMKAVYHTGDPKLCSELYSEDCICMPPSGHPVFSGRAAVQKVFEQTPPTAGLSFSADEILVFGDMATERGHYETKGTKGSYVLIWKKVNGKWLVYNNIFN